MVERYGLAKAVRCLLLHVVLRRHHRRLTVAVQMHGGWVIGNVLMMRLWHRRYGWPIRMIDNGVAIVFGLWAHSHGVRVFFGFHAAILEPNLYLSFR